MVTCEVPADVEDYEELEALEAFRVRTHGSDELPLTDAFFVACELDNTAGRLLGEWKFAIDGVKVVSSSGEEVVAESPNVLYWARTYADTGAADGEAVMAEAPDLANRHIQRNFAPEGGVETVFLFSEEPLTDIAEVYVVQDVTGGGTDLMTPVS